MDQAGIVLTDIHLPLSTGVKTYTTVPSCVRFSVKETKALVKISTNQGL